MYNEQELAKKIEQILSPKRYQHSIGVMESAVKMAQIHQLDVEKARIAGLMHDVAKEVAKEEMLPMCSRYHVALDDMLRRDLALVHGPLGAAICEKDYGIEDEEILDAIRYHTLAKPELSPLGAVIYLADMIEPNRKKHKGFEELRELCYSGENLDRCLLEGINLTLSFLLKTDKRMHYMTVEARNYLISKLSV